MSRLFDLYEHLPMPVKWSPFYSADHFIHAVKMVAIGSDAKREDDSVISRLF